jgi:predicted transcriptional regulator of viral defense system
MLQRVKTHLSLSDCEPMVVWVSTKKRRKKREAEKKKEGKMR